MTVKKPLIVACHQASAANTSYNPSYVAWAALYHFANAGYPIVASNMHGDQWGNATARADLANAVTLGLARFPDRDSIFLFCTSMGGLAGTKAISKGTFGAAPVVGAVMLDAVTDLASLYSNATYTASIDTAYSITRGTLSGAMSVGATSLPTTASFPTIGTQLMIGNGTANVETVTTTGASTGTSVAVTAAAKTHASADQVSDYPTKTAGESSVNLTASTFAGCPRWLHVASSADTNVPKANNADVFSAMLSGLVTENATRFRTDLGHLSAAAVQPADLLAFLARCL